jgi:hypothetical protein
LQLPHDLGLHRLALQSELGCTTPGLGHATDQVMIHPATNTCPGCETVNWDNQSCRTEREQTGVCLAVFLDFRKHLRCVADLKPTPDHQPRTVMHSARTWPSVSTQIWRRIPDATG